MKKAEVLLDISSSLKTQKKLIPSSISISKIQIFLRAIFRSIVLGFMIVSHSKRANIQDSKRTSSKFFPKPRNLESISQIATQKTTKSQETRRLKRVLEQASNLAVQKRQKKKKNLNPELRKLAFSDLPTKCIVQTAISPTLSLRLSIFLQTDKKEPAKTVSDSEKSSKLTTIKSSILKARSWRRFCHGEIAISDNLFSKSSAKNTAWMAKKSEQINLNGFSM